jgi:hypothetical protein
MKTIITDNYMGADSFDRVAPQGVKRECFKLDSSPLYQVIHYSSLRHMIDSVDHGIDKLGWKDIYRRKHGSLPGEEDTWAHGDTLRTAKATSEALRHGRAPKKVVDQMREYCQELINLPEAKLLQRIAQTIKRKRLYGISGSELDIDKLMTGNPEHWYAMTKGRKKNVVQIYIKLTLSCGHGEKTFFQLGALAAAACDLITKAGLSVELIGLHGARGTCTEHRDGYEMTMIPIKGADETLDIGKVCATGSPGLLRYYGFYNEVCLLNTSKASGGLGQVVPIPEDLKKELDVKHLIEASWVSEKEQRLTFLTGLLQSLTTSEKFLEAYEHQV